MSAPTALVRHTPREARLLPRTHRRYRAGIAMETLEVRRVLSAAVAAVATPDELTGETAIIVDADNTAADTSDTEIGCGTADGQPATDNQPADEAEGEWGDLELMFTTAVAADDTGEALGDDADVAWPEGWGWSLDRLPTQDEIDSANNGDDLGGLWVPVRTLGGDQDPIFDDGQAAEDGRPLDDNGQVWDDGGEAGNDGEIWTLDGATDDGATDDGATLDDPGAAAEAGGTADPIALDNQPPRGGVVPVVVFYSRGELPNERTLTDTPVEKPVTQTPTDAQPAAGGAPAPVTFATPAADNLLLGKLRTSVTDEAPSDLPFMN